MSGNAHQRRKARRAKNREPWAIFVPTDRSKEWAHALKGDGTAKIVDFPLIRGEIGTIEG